MLVWDFLRKTNPGIGIFLGIKYERLSFPPPPPSLKYLSATPPSLKFLSGPLAAPSPGMMDSREAEGETNATQTAHVRAD